MFGYPPPYLNKKTLIYWSLKETKKLGGYALLWHQLYVLNYGSSPCNGIQALLRGQSAWVPFKEIWKSCTISSYAFRYTSTVKHDHAKVLH